MLLFIHYFILLFNRKVRKNVNRKFIDIYFSYINEYSYIYILNKLNNKNSLI